MVIEDKEFIDSSMGGKPWKAGKFAFSLRISLWSEHLGLRAGEVGFYLMHITVIDVYCFLKRVTSGCFVRQFEIIVRKGITVTEQRNFMSSYFSHSIILSSEDLADNLCFLVIGWSNK